MRYKVNVGINWTPAGSSVEKRAEPGELVDDLQDPVAEWMLRDGIVEPAEATSTGVNRGAVLPCG